jgi:HlyD family secretion protein
MNSQWSLNPIKVLQARYREKMNQVEQDLEIRSVSLPPVAPWTRWLTQAILIGISVGAGWSVLARVDVVVNASGKLETLSQSQVIQSRAGGIVTGILVKEGQSVNQGQLLMQLDKTPLYNQLQELMLQRNRLVEEVAVLRVAQQGQALTALGNRRVSISPELMKQVQTRLLLVAQLTGDPSNLDPVQRQRYELFQQQLRDRRDLTGLQTNTLQTQIAEARAKIAQTQFQLKTEQELLARLRPLAEQGAISRVNVLQREVTVSELQTQLTQNTLQKKQLEIGQIQTQVESGKSLNETQQSLQSQLAELDTKFDAIIKDGQTQLIQINAKLNQVKLDLKNQDLRAPVDGIVFELGPKLPGVVSQPGQTLLQVVPNESLVAQVKVANSDIANIRVGMPVDVRVDAYPFTEFGSVKATVSKIGREAIKLSDQAPGPTVFPVEVRLDRQFLERSSERFTLTPGMSLVAMIKLRQRAPISYVTEEITKAFDGIKSVK